MREPKSRLIQVYFHSTNSTETINYVFYFIYCVDVCFCKKEDVVSKKEVRHLTIVFLSLKDFQEPLLTANEIWVDRYSMARIKR